MFNIYIFFYVFAPKSGWSFTKKCLECLCLRKNSVWKFESVCLIESAEKSAQKLFLRTSFLVELHFFSLVYIFVKLLQTLLYRYPLFFGQLGWHHQLGSICCSGLHHQAWMGQCWWLQIRLPRQELNDIILKSLWKLLAKITGA